MTWTDTFWSAYKIVSYTTELVVCTTIGATVRALNSVGTLACMIGGAGFATSYSIDESLNASYYGSLNANGLVTLGLDAKQLRVKVNETMPFSRNDQMNWGATYNLVDYIYPYTIQTYSSIFFISGTALKVLCANVRHWQQNREQARDFKNKHGVKLMSPFITEYLGITTAAIFESLAQSSLSSAVTSNVINSTGLLGSSQSFTYPFQSNQTINSTYYKGPVTSTVFHLSEEMSKNITIKWPFINPFRQPVELSILIEALIKGQGDMNATYGAGIFLKSNSKPNIPLGAISSTVAATSFLMSNSMFKLVKKQCDNRIEYSERSLGIV